MPVVFIGIQPHPRPSGFNKQGINSKSSTDWFTYGSPQGKVWQCLVVCWLAGRRWSLVLDHPTMAVMRGRAFRQHPTIACVKIMRKRLDADKAPRNARSFPSRVSSPNATVAIPGPNVGDVGGVCRVMKGQFPWLTVSLIHEGAFPGSPFTTPW
jgi:hypothetical protein